MPFTVATIWEIWRLVTITPMGVDRQLSSDMKIGDYQVPKGTTITIAIYAIHHNEKHFDRPDLFRPDRFLDASGSLLKNPKIMPFQIGKQLLLILLYSLNFII
jgi:cytochrome P450